MKILRSFIFVALITLGINSAQARIGETFEECKVRYGAPSYRTTNIACFSKSGISIVVEFYNEKADALSFTKEDKSPLSKEELTTLLAASSGNAEWIQERKGEAVLLITKDNNFTAAYSTLNHSLFPCTRQFVERHKGERPESLKDF